MALAASVLCALLAPQPAGADEPSGQAFAFSRVATVEELEQQQGRFVLPNGAVLDLVLTSTQMVNGRIVNTVELSTAGLAGVRGSSIYIHNAMDNAIIRNLNNLTLNYTRPSAERQALYGSILSLQNALSLGGGR
ncbi:MAG TPA: hypothetical protein VD978_29510 [Azospirillum sp.]|nr:hypothetical protein [Azospirillum sp.]